METRNKNLGKAQSSVVIYLFETKENKLKFDVGGRISNLSSTPMAVIFFLFKISFSYPHNSLKCCSRAGEVNEEHGNKRSLAVLSRQDSLGK